MAITMDTVKDSKAFGDLPSGNRCRMDHDELRVFAQTIRRARQALGISVKALAQACGIKPVTLYVYEKAGCCPSKEVHSKLAAALSLPLPPADQDPRAGLYVVRVTYCTMRRTGRPIPHDVALKSARVLRKSEGPNCKVEVLPAIGNWHEPERVLP